MRQLFTILYFLFTMKYSLANLFDYTVKIKQAKTTGYHQLSLSPELIRKTQADFSDLRLLLGNKEIPYHIKKETKADSIFFVECDIIEQELQKDNVYYCVFRQAEKKAINNLYIISKNIDSQKKINLLGSNDHQYWYPIEEKTNPYTSYYYEKSEKVKQLFFSTKEYMFYKLVMKDVRDKRLKIIHAGYYAKKKNDAVNSGIAWDIQSQKGTKTLHEISLKTLKPHYLEKIQIQLSEPIRHRMGVKVYGLMRSKDFDRPIKKQIAKGTLGPETINEFAVEAGVYDSLYLEIENKNQQNYQLRKIISSCFDYYAIAKLSNVRRYMFKFGNEKLSMPSYELKDYSQKKYPILPQLLHEEVVPTQQLLHKKKKSYSIIFFILLSVVIFSVFFFIGRKAFRG